MDIASIVGFGLIAAVLSILLKQYKPEYAILMSIGAGVVMLMLITVSAAPLFEAVESLLVSSNMPIEYIEILFKSLGICFLTQIACDTCKDAGESAIAAKIELAGRVSVLIISIPLFTKILSVVGVLFNL